jgi:GxxExxY protein
MHFNEVSGEVVDAAMKVHSALGAGLLDTVYEACLAYELNQRGFRTASQLPLPVIYRGVRIDLGFRLDILVENLIVVEIKAVDAITPVHQAQLLTYLKLSQKHVGLLINFNVVHLRDGIRRMVNGHPPAEHSVSSESSVVRQVSSEPPVSSVVRPVSSVYPESSVVKPQPSTAKRAS